MRLSDLSDPADARAGLTMMRTIRQFEEAVEQLHARGMLMGTMHLSIGQEAVPTGICGALDDGDLITSTHRGHGHALAHGADPTRMLAELLGRETGYCRGRGGSMHIADVAAGNLGANGIVAGSMTIAAGAGLAQQERDTGAVVACFFGDGAANEGAFHEALNLAAIWSLPVVYVCENNQYGMSMPSAEASAGDSIAARGDAYGIPNDRVDGNDLREVLSAATDAVERARSGGGPTLLECVTYRYRGHSRSDRNLYRTEDEIEQWRQRRDPIDRIETRCLQQDVLSEDEIAEIRDEVREDIRAAVREANEGRRTDPESLEGAVYAQ